MLLLYNIYLYNKKMKYASQNNTPQCESHEMFKLLKQVHQKSLNFYTRHINPYEPITSTTNSKDETSKYTNSRITSKDIIMNNPEDPRSASNSLSIHLPPLKPKQQQKLYTKLVTHTKDNNKSSRHQQPILSLKMISNQHIKFKQTGKIQINNNAHEKYQKQKFTNPSYYYKKRISTECQPNNTNGPTSDNYCSGSLQVTKSIKRHKIPQESQNLMTLANNDNTIKRRNEKDQEQKNLVNEEFSSNSGWENQDAPQQGFSIQDAVNRKKYGQKRKKRQLQILIATQQNDKSQI